MEAIHIQSFVTAPPAEVWRVLLGRPDVVLDALPVRTWPDGREELSPSRLRTPWPAPAGGGTSVEITLQPFRGGSRVEVRHQGWEEGPGVQDEVAGHFAGWLQALAALGLLVETGQDPRASTAALAERERYFASAEIPSGADTVFRAITDADVLRRWSEDAFDGTELVESVEERFVRWKVAAPVGPSGELVMILRPTPRGTHCAVAEYGVVGRAASSRWPGMLERLARFLR